jgi:hypothetical protein
VYICDLFSTIMYISSEAHGGHLDLETTPTFDEKHFFFETLFGHMAFESGLKVAVDKIFESICLVT